MRAGFGVIELPADFWGVPDVRDALSHRDVAHLFRLVQKATGASQTKIGIATGLSQAQVSEIISGRRQVNTIDVLRRIVAGFAMPAHARAGLLMPAEFQEDTLDPYPSLPSAMPEQRHTLLASRAEPVAVFTSREEFTSEVPPHVLFDGAQRIRAVGISLNLLCQQYAEHRMIRLIEHGAQVSCLFLDPEGESIRAREVEEAWTAGHLSALTALNLKAMRRTRDRLPLDRRQGLTLGVYNETVRFNIVLVDQSMCVAQPYLPSARGVEAPTMLIRRHSASGLFATFENVFDSLWERCQEL